MSKFRFDLKAKKFRGMKAKLLDEMANNAVNEFKVVSFDKKSFDGKAWAPNKVTDGRQQLVKTGRMRQSITILERMPDSRVVGSNVPYAVYHNEGAKHLPQRKFIGKNKKLEAKNKKVIMKYLKTL